MSYCRFSSDFFECDVYVYADVNGGWTTHVADGRLRQRVPEEIKALPFPDSEAAYMKWRDALPSDEMPCRVFDPETKETVPGVMRTPKDSEYIDLSEISEFAGETFNDDTPGECADRLEKIRESGLLVPQYAIDELRREQEQLCRG